jgi:hypothetical protein
MFCCRLPLLSAPALAQVMRGKIRARQYVNWNELVRDFELICSNAMKYNQRRSRVHKQVGRPPATLSLLLLLLASV